jgi:hypothetical protein
MNVPPTLIRWGTKRRARIIGAVTLVVTSSSIILSLLVNGLSICICVNEFQARHSLAKTHLVGPLNPTVDPDSVHFGKS